MDLSGLFNKNAGTTSIVSIDVAKSLAYCFEENSLKVLSLQKVNKVSGHSPRSILCTTKKLWKFSKIRNTWALV